MTGFFCFCTGDVEAVGMHEVKVDAPQAHIARILAEALPSTHKLEMGDLRRRVLDANAGFAEDTFQRLCDEALPNAAKDDRTLIPVEAFLTALSVHGPCTQDVAPLLSDESGAGARGLIVRSMAGDVVFDLSASRMSSIALKDLRERVRDAVGKSECAFQLLDGAVELTEVGLNSARQSPKEVLELTIVFSPVPELLPEDRPEEEQLSVIRDRLGCFSEDIQLTTLVALRKKLSVDEHPPCWLTVEAGLIPVLLSFCRTGAGQSRELQFEALWCLTNVGSGAHEPTRALVEAGAVAVFAEVLSSPHDDIAETGFWALGNIAGDCGEFRDQVMEADVIPRIIDILLPVAQSHEHPSSMKRNAAWLMSNLARGQPRPDLETVRVFLPLIRDVVAQGWVPEADLLLQRDMEVCADCLWAVSYISSGADESIEAVTAVEGLVDQIIKCMKMTGSVESAAVRIAGNIASADREDLCQTVIDAGVLGVAKEKMSTDCRRMICKELYWMLSNIAVGSRDQIQSLIDEGLLSMVIAKLNSDDLPGEAKKEASFVLGNLIAQGSVDQVSFLIKEKGAAALLTVAGFDGAAVASLNAIISLVRRVEKDHALAEPALLAELQKTLSSEALAGDGPLLERLQCAERRLLKRACMPGWPLVDTAEAMADADPEADRSKDVAPPSDTAKGEDTGQDPSTRGGPSKGAAKPSRSWWSRVPLPWR